MKKLRKACAAVLLTCLVAVSVSAGDMSAGYVPPPPPPPPQMASEEVEPTVTTDEADVVEVLKTLLQTALLLF